MFCIDEKKAMKVTLIFVLIKYKINNQEECVWNALSNFCIWIGYHQ